MPHIDLDAVRQFRRDYGTISDEHIDALTTELAEARRTLQEFLDWGAMTASDRAYFERKFRALLPAPPED